MKRGNNSKDYSLSYKKGIKFYKLGDYYYNEALKFFNKSLRLRPDFIPALIGKGVILGEIGCYLKALEIFDRVIEIQPENYIAWSNRGIVLSNLHLYREAIESFDKAIEINPNFASAYLNKACTFYRLGHYLGALILLEKAGDLESDYVIFHNQGLVLIVLGDYCRALKAFEKSIELKWDNPETWFYKGYLHYLRGEKEDMDKCIDKIVELEIKYGKKLKEQND